MENNTAISTPAKLYSSIHKLPYEVFEDIIVENDLNLLIISGEAEPSELQQAWEAIIEQYSKAIGKEDEDGFYTTWQEYLISKRKVDKITMYVELLRHCYVKKWADDLSKTLRTKIQLDPTDPEKYEADLDRCLALVARWSLQCEICEAQILALQSARGGNTEDALPTRERYIKIRINLNDHAGYQINYEKITTGEYCERVKRYMAYVEVLEMKQTEKKTY